MPKQLEITPKIAAAIARSTDSSVDPASVAVFETISLNTLPINKKGTLYEGATTTETTLRQMADYLNAGQNFVPLHQLHDQGNALPVGRTFAGEVVTNDQGMAELRTQFYLPRDTGAELISKLDSGTIDEVSVGLIPLHLNCSECGFDYTGPDVSFDNIWGRVCNNDHEIGVDGVHTIVSGMGRFLEQSLVSLGAANKARIQSRAKSLMGAANYNERLAATGIAPDALLLTTTPQKPKEMSMDLTQLVKELTDAKVALTVSETALATLKASSEAATTAHAAALKAATDEVAALKAAADTKLPEVQAKLTTTETALTAATTFIRTEADRLAVAASLDKPAEGADLEALTASISNARTKLVASIPVGGRAVAALSLGENASPAPQSSAFKTPKSK